MFEGTLRENIDPVGQYLDADIWVALEHVCISLRAFNVSSDMCLCC